MCWDEVDCLFTDSDDLASPRLTRPPAPRERRLALQGRIDRADIRAELNRGVLQITVPRIADPAAHKVEIEAAG